MRLLSWAWLCTALTACATSRPVAAKPREAVHYRVDLRERADQTILVEARVPSRAARTRLTLPAWTPGSYRIRDFAKHVFGFSATTADGDPLPVELLDKQTWQVRNGGEPFVVRYRVFAATASVRTSVLTDTHASLNGASVFVFEPGEVSRPRDVEILAPQGWTVHTPLRRRGSMLHAPDYDVLVDSPIEVGTPSVQTYEQAGTRFEYVLTSPEDLALDQARLVEDAAALSRTFGEMLGGFPMQRYMFFMRVSDLGGGGLEHADSTMMMMERGAFDQASGYDRAARLTAHEFFHLWNVKRIRDRALVPFDYSREAYSSLLWFHEGFTETMEAQAMLRSGLWTPKEFLDDLAQSYTAYLKKPGRNAMPLSEVSFRAWTHAYQPEPNHRNETISYYEKGDLVGVALDLEIRMRSAGKGSLTGVFRRLMRDFGTKGKGITTQDIVRAASAEATEDLSAFFASYVEGTEPLPLPSLLERAGVEVASRTPWQRSDGTDAPDADPLRAWTGIDLRGTRVSNVVPGSPASAAKVMRDDEIIAIAGVRVRDEADVDEALGRVGPGGRVEVTAFRGSRLLSYDLDVVENPHRIYTFAAPEQPGDVAAGWLAL